MLPLGSFTGKSFPIPSNSFCPLKILHARPVAPVCPRCFLFDASTHYPALPLESIASPIGSPASEELQIFQVFQVFQTCNFLNGLQFKHISNIQQTHPGALCAILKNQRQLKLLIHTLICLRERERAFGCGERAARRNRKQTRKRTRRNRGYNSKGTNLFQLAINFFALYASG